MIRVVLALSCLGFALAGCPKSEPPVRVGVDESLEPLGLAQFLRAAYEEQSKERLELVHLDTNALAKAALEGELDYALVLSEEGRAKLEEEGIPVRAKVFAHEELIYIGPFENHLGDHIEAATAVGIMQAMARANYRYLRGRPGSVERARHDLLFKKSKDRMEPGAFFETKLEGAALVKKAVETNSFALVRRSALLSAAKDGVRPHRIYREGDVELVLRLALVEVHPGKTKRPRRPGFFDFLTGPEGTKVIERFGAERFGYPVYGIGEPPAGEGAGVPKLETRPDAPSLGAP